MINKESIKTGFKLSFCLFKLRIKRFVFFLILSIASIIILRIKVQIPLPFYVYLLIMLFPIIEFILKLIRLYTAYKYYEHMLQQSIYLQQQCFKFLIFVFGKIRAGKDLFMTCFSRTQSQIYYMEINEKMEKIRNKLYFLDFNLVHQLIEFHLEQEKLDNKVYAKLVMLDLNLTNEFVYDDNIKIESLYKLLSDYIELYKYMIRNAFIVANMPIKEITGEYCKILNFNELKLKLGYDLTLEQYNIISITEYSNQYPSMDYSGETVKKKNENGEKLFLTTFGHLFKENSKLITTTQRIEASGKILRVDFTDNIRINGFNIKSLFKWELALIEKRITKLTKKQLQKDKRRELKNKLSSKRFFKKVFKYNSSIYSLENNKQKKKIFKYLLLFDGLYPTYSYFKYDVDNYSNQEDIERANPTSAEHYIMFFRLLDGFGKYNTHIYNIIAREKYKTTMSSFADLENFDGLDIDVEKFSKTSSKIFNDFIKKGGGY